MWPSRIVAIAAVIAFSMLTAACQPDGLEVVVSDSAGVRIVDNVLSGPPPQLPFTVADSATFMLGHADADPRYDLVEYFGVRRLASGLTAVADANPIAVRLFDSHGNFISEVARAGRGVGEIHQLVFFAGFQDTIVVCCGNGLLYFDTSGALVGSTDSIASPLHLLLSDGSWIERHEADPFALYADKKEVVLHTVYDTLFLARRGDSTRTPIGTFVRADQLYILDPQPNPLGSSIHRVHAPFFANSRMRMAPGGFLYTNAHEMGADVHDLRGNRKMSFRLNLPNARATRAVYDSYRERVLRRHNKPAEDAYMQWFLDEMPRPQHLPAVEEVFVGDDSRVWMRQRLGEPGESNQWHVFSADGRYEGAIDLPATWFLQQSGSDYILFTRQRADGGVIVELRALIPRPAQ